MPLKPLEPSGIIEAIEGPCRDPTLKRRYGLTVADGLAPTIAEDLVIDAGSALAPTLQVLLTNMWKGAGGKGGRFDQALYKRLRDEGYLLRDVLEDGLKAVRQWREDVESSGLALDVLVHHVTEFDTAAQRTRAELAARYPHRADALPGLLDKLKDGYLLIEADARSEPSAPAVPATRLAHDTLAPLVHARFRTSVAPGQRARRLLENRAPEWQDGKTGSCPGRHRPGQRRGRRRGHAGLDRGRGSAGRGQPAGRGAEKGPGTGPKAAACATSSTPWRGPWSCPWAPWASPGSSGGKLRPRRTTRTSKPRSPRTTRTRPRSRH